MKAKLKFDQAKVKDFLVAHTEKIVFGGFVVVFLLFVYFAMAKKPYSETPSGFITTASNVESRIRDAQPPKVDPPPPPTVPPAVNSDVYKLAIALREPDFETRVRRTEPLYLTVADLHVGSGFAAIAYMAPPDAPLADVPGAAAPGAPPFPKGAGKGGLGVMGGGRFGDTMPPKGRPQAKGGSKGGGLGGNAKGGRFGNEGGDFGGEEGDGRFGRGPGMRGMPGMPGAPGMPFGPAGPGAGVAGAESEQFVLPTAPAGSQIKGKTWAVVTGLVPDLKQAAEYRRCFANAIMQDPQTDEPYYTGFKVQRAEVKPGAAVDQLTWKDVDMKAVFVDMENWMDYGFEPVDPMYLGSFEVCHPLPALVGKNYDDSVGHPKIPMVPKNDPFGGGVMGGHFGGIGGDEMPGRGGMGMRMGGGMGGMGARPGMGMNMGGGLGTKMGGMGVRPGMGMNMGGGMRPGMGGMGGGLGQRGGMGRVPGGGRFGEGKGGAGRFGPQGLDEGGPGGMFYEQPKIEHHLFRFFDFSVTPGKTYRYRVQLELANPNLNYPANTLDAKKPGLAQGETRTSDWSAPSPEIAIPRDSHLLAGKVLQPKGLNEQKVEVLVRNWNSEHARVALQMKNLMRGEVVNFFDEAIVEDPMTGQLHKEPKVDFRTNSVLVDIAGGERLDTGTSKPVAPVEILVMGPDGQLSVGSQVTEADELERGMKEFERRKAAVLQPDPNALPPGGFPEGGAFDPESPQNSKGGRQLKGGRGR